MADTTDTTRKTLTDADIATVRYVRGGQGQGGHDVDSDAHAHTDVDTDTGHAAPTTDADRGAGHTPKAHSDHDAG